MAQDDGATSNMKYEVLISIHDTVPVVRYLLNEQTPDT